MLTRKCRRRIECGRCVLLVEHPHQISKKIIEECSGRMLDGLCPLFQEQIDPRVLHLITRVQYVS